MQIGTIAAGFPPAEHAVLDFPRPWPTPPAAGEDALAPARGILLGLLLGVVGWAGIVGAVWLAV